VHRFIPNTQTFLYVSALTSLVMKLNQCRTKVSNSILPGWLAAKSLSAHLLLFCGFWGVFLRSLTSLLLRDASKMQKSGFAGSTGSQHQTDGFSAYLSQFKFSGTEGAAPGDLRPGVSACPSQRETLGREARTGVCEMFLSHLAPSKVFQKSGQHLLVTLPF